MIGPACFLREVVIEPIRGRFGENDEMMRISDCTLRNRFSQDEGESVKPRRACSLLGALAGELES